MDMKGMEARRTESYRGGKSVTIEKTEMFGIVAIMAASFAERWGMVAGEPDGEDSAGRAKLKLSTPEQVVERACEMAELLYQEFHERDWMVKIPLSVDPKPLEELERN